ncbi:alanine racemase [Parasulfitobacter algicola]|uniref:Alanine racemase n=1 Tax=Parasulfitobacter algicola TaxID=2614809 RepID=A0ABX2IN95_9RHOB|nr:alanine racemase [Sulfitobacter algicola]NSX54361.1 alanine racemase [Sulfitobacter algicola]
MGTGILTIDLGAVTENWRALDRMTGTGTETAAVVKADGYGLGAGRVARALAQSGARRFFVAVAEEGAAVRQALGPGPEICIFSGHMRGDTDMIGDLMLTPMLNSMDQLTRHFEALPGHPFGLQLDSGMNRLGMEPAEWAAVRDVAMSQAPSMVISHLACADDPNHPMNGFQLGAFREMTADLTCTRSLAATGGCLLGKAYHFDLTRPGIGLYGGAPFSDAAAVAHLALPIIQIRDLMSGEAVGYGNTWIADDPARIATVAAGYADGLIRAMGNKGFLYAGDVACPIVGRVSMDLITVDITELREIPSHLDILGPYQSVDDLATQAGTIGYEILTSLGARYNRRYVG